MSRILGQVLKISFAFGFYALTSTCVAFAQLPQNAKVLLQRASDTYANLNQYEVTVKGTVERVTKSGAKQTDTKTFKVAIRRPDRIRLETDRDNALFELPTNTGGPTGPMVFIGNEKGVWLYAPDLKRYGKITAKINPEAAALVGTASNWVTFIEQGISLAIENALTDADQAKIVAEEHLSLDGKDVDCDVIQIDPDSSVWIDKGSHLIVREVDREADALSTTDLLFGRINISLPDDVFVLSPRADAKEEDVILNRNPFR